MWVIFNQMTGEEYDRIEDYDEALGVVRSLNYENEDAAPWTKRWEE